MEDNKQSTKNNKTEQSPPLLTNAVNKNESKGPGWLAFVALMIVALVGVSASAYLWYQKSIEADSQQQMQINIAAVAQRMDSQANLMSEYQQQQAGQFALAKHQQKKNELIFEQLQGRLDGQHRRLVELSTTDRADWLLAEAEYLIGLANQRLLMGKEITGAYNLLKAADQVIKELNDHGLFSVRQALADDMAVLHVAGKLDIEGLYLQLGALAKRTDQIRLFEPPSLSVKEAEPELATEDWREQWDRGIDGAWNKLKHYVEIKRRDEIYKPVLAPEYEAAVRQNVHLMFEQAQMALLAGKQTLYQDSLNKAQVWLHDYYTLDARSAQLVSQKIEQLKNQPIEITLPDISGSHNRLKDYIDSLHAVPSVNKSKAAAGKPS